MTLRPFALHITWTCYGTWLPGDERGYVAGAFRAWADPVPELIAATPPGRVIRNDILDRPPGLDLPERRPRRVVPAEVAGGVHRARQLVDRAAGALG